MNEAHTCPICAKATPHRTVYEKWGYPILRCEICGLGSAQVPENFDSRSIYDETYFKGERPDGYADYANSERILRSEFRRTVSFLRKKGVAEGRLLEIGCAYGFMLSEASRHFQCVGVDVSEAGLAHCRAQGHEVYASIDRIGTDAAFDAVVLLDCIEHLPNPVDTLEKASSRLRPGGALLLTTGDWDSWLARRMGRRWRLMTPPQHLFFFSRRSFEALFGKMGFEIVSWSRPWKLVPFGLIAYQLGNRLGFRMPWLEKVSSVGLPANLFDTVRLVARKRA
jgi:SAM-dependent methyltransferase